MKTRLTPVSKFLMTMAVVAALFFGGKWILENTSFGKNLKSQSETLKSEVPESPSIPGNTNNTTEKPTTADTEATAESNSGFTYVAPEPISGTLKGVVELGASGFNSFIVRIDKDKNWKLEKSEFGNSLVTENMATDDDVRIGLKKYIGSMLDYGVNGKNIHFVVSSGAAKAEVTQKIVSALKTLNYRVNTVTPQQEGAYALKCVMPKDYEEEAFVTDIGSGNTKISWINGSSISAFETYGAKYFQNGVDDGKVYTEVKKAMAEVPSMKRSTCFIIGGVPFELAKKIRLGKERFTVLKDPKEYKLEDAKAKAGLNIYKAIKDATGTQQFVFDWDSNFTIGFLLSLP